MSLRGLHTPGRSSLSYLKVVMLFVVVLVVSLFLRRKISMSNYSLILQQARFNGFSEETARYVTAQSAHETNGWTSHIFNSNNNAFGMTYVGQSTAAGQKNGYAYYINVNQSVTDFSKWWARRNLFYMPILSLADYVRHLKVNNYFEDTEANYLRGCQFWYGKIFGNE
jgi:hypothetical protein